jgi:hypothetical protein
MTQIPGYGRDAPLSPHIQTDHRSIVGSTPALYLTGTGFKPRARKQATHDTVSLSPTRRIKGQYFRRSMCTFTAFQIRYYRPILEANSFQALLSVNGKIKLSL